MSFLRRFASSKQQQNDSAFNKPNTGTSGLKRALSSLGSKTNRTAASGTFTSHSSMATPPAYAAQAPHRSPNVNTVPTDAPPAYSPPVASTADDRYAFLTSFDTVFLIDDSGSMAGRSWRETAAAISAITPVCTAHDADGIDIYFLNNPDNSEYKNITKAQDVMSIFDSVRPYGGTPTGTKLNRILKPYLQELQTKGPDNVKPLNIIVITDGVPSDDPESVIRMAARKLEQVDAPSWQVGIQFFQVGNEAGAAQALEDLDDLADPQKSPDPCVRDIVDTVPWKSNHGGLSAEGILKVLLGAVNKKLDRQRNSADHLRPRRH